MVYQQSSDTGQWAVYAAALVRLLICIDEDCNGNDYLYIKLEAGSMETELGAKERAGGSWKQLSLEDTLPSSAMSLCRPSSLR